MFVQAVFINLVISYTHEDLKSASHPHSSHSVLEFGFQQSQERFTILVLTCTARNTLEFKFAYCQANMHFLFSLVENFDGEHLFLFLMKRAFCHNFCKLSFVIENFAAFGYWKQKVLQWLKTFCSQLS